MELKAKRFIGKNKSCSCSMTGVWRAVTYCRGVVAVFHSPRACAHIARTMDVNSAFSTRAEGRRGKTETIPLVSVQLSERESIFGGVDKLQQCLAYVVDTYHPECIVIANSCVAGVIGDDVESTARKVETAYGIPVLTVGTFGFLDGEYYEGYLEMATKLMDRFFRPCQKEPGTAMLLGDSGGPWGSYAREVTQILERIGIRVIGQFPGFMPFRELPDLPRAQAAIILGGRRKPADGLQRLAATLEERFDVPFVRDSYPIGAAGTFRWIRDMGRLFGKEAAARDVEAAERERLHRALERYRPSTEGKTAVLCLGRWLRYFQPDTILETTSLLGLHVTGISLLDGYTPAEREKMEQAVRSCTTLPLVDRETGARLAGEADIVLTTHEIQGRGLRQIFLPMLPQAGIGAMVRMMEAIYRTLCSRQARGGIRYV